MHKSIERAVDVFWFLYLLLFPIYLLPSGGLQLSDLAIIALTGLLIPHFIKTIRSLDTAKAMTLFVGYILLVNLFWYLNYLDFSILKNNLFYIFNLLVFLIVLSQAKREKFWKVSFYGAFASMILQITLLPFGRLFAGFRPVIFFNNPNQLGYWALLITCLIWLINRRLKLNQYLYIGLLVFSLFFVFLSLSRAGMASALLLGVFALFFNSWKKTVVLLLLVIPVTVLNYDSFISNLEIVEKVEHRVTHTGTSDNVEGRGYDRIWNHPWHLAFGAGEGAYGRFRSGYLGEMHSSVGTLLFSYGIAGCLLLIFFLILVIKQNKFTEYFILIPLLIYSLTHMGLRFSYFWIVIAFLAAYPLKFNTLAVSNNEDTLLH